MARKKSAYKNAFDFFRKHGGGSYRRGEHPSKARRRAGRDLARAEHQAKKRGWYVKWEYDEEPYEMGDLETEMPNEVLSAILYDENGNVLASLGGIGDPDRNYRRVVEAELASEALSQRR